MHNILHFALVGASLPVALGGPDENGTRKGGYGEEGPVLGSDVFRIVACMVNVF